MSKMDSKSTFSRRLRGIEIIECLEIFDVECNLKQFVGLDPGGLFGSGGWNFGLGGGIFRCTVIC